MTIEFSNTIEPKNHSTMAMAIVITASALFFIPTTLIILGYYSSQPTGSLVSPLPQGTLSQSNSQKTNEATINPAITPTPILESQNFPIIAAPNEATISADADISPTAGSNIIDKVATIDPGITQTVIKDSDVNEDSQVYLSPRPGDKAIYSLRSKTAGEFTINVNDASDSIRYIDYHIVNP